MGGGSKQPKIPPGGGFGRGRGGVQFLYIFLEGGGDPSNLEPPLATPLPIALHLRDSHAFESELVGHIKS